MIFLLASIFNKILPLFFIELLYWVRESNKNAYHFNFVKKISNFKSFYSYKYSWVEQSIIFIQSNQIRLTYVLKL